jgi:hypothetical protein
MGPVRLFLLALVGAVGFAAAHASAESEQPDEWNQEEVTRVAADFSAQMRELASDPGLEPTQATAMQQREHHAAVLTVRRMATLADDLAAKLQLGHGYEQTRPIFEQVQLLRQDIVAYAGNSWIAPETRVHIQGIQKLLTVLTYFYRSR